METIWGEKARKGRAWAVTTVVTKDQDIPTMKQFLGESLMNELRFQVSLTDICSGALRGRLCPDGQRRNLWAAALRKKYYFELSSAVRDKKNKITQREVGSLDSPMAWPEQLMAVASLSGCSFGCPWPLGDGYQPQEKFLLISHLLPPNKHCPRSLPRCLQEETWLTPYLWMAGVPLNFFSDFI